MFDLKWFAHGLNIFNLTKGQAPQETFENDTIMPQIVQAHAQQREVARGIDGMDDYEGRSRHETSLRDRILKNSVHLAADRIALRKTLYFIEERWRAGAGVDETFEAAEQYRVDEYSKLTSDKPRMHKLKVYFRNMRPEEARARLVESAPIRKDK